MALNISSLSDSLSKSGESVKSTAQTSSSLVATGAKDSLVAVDGYGKKTIDVLTSMKNGVLDSLSATKNYLMNTKIADLGSLSDALAQAVAVKNAAQNNIAQLSAFVGQTTSTIKGIEDSVINTASNTINTLNQSINSTFDSINGVGTTLSSQASVFNANNFITSVNTLLRSSSMTFDNLKDKLSETALKASILQYSSQLGLSNVIKSVYNSDPTNHTLTAALGSSLPSSLASGNLELINTLVDTLTGQYIITTVPNAIQLVLQNYTFDTNVKSDQYPQRGADLVSTLARIDPNWDKSQSAFWGSNLQVYSGISSKAKLVLSTLGDYNRRMAIITHYTTGSTAAKARALYPYLAIQ